MKRAFYVFIFLSVFIGIDIAAHADELDTVPEDNFEFEVEEIEEGFFTFQLPQKENLADAIVPMSTEGLQVAYANNLNIWQDKTTSDSNSSLAYAWVTSGIRYVSTGDNTQIYFSTTQPVSSGISLTPINLPYTATRSGWIVMRAGSPSQHLPLNIGTSNDPEPDPGTGGGSGGSVDVDLTEVINGLETVNENILILTYIGNNIVVLLVLLIFVPKLKALGRRLVDNHNTHV